MSANEVATILNVLPRLDEMQRLTGGHLHISGPKKSWTIRCIRGWVNDVIVVVPAILALAAFLPLAGRLSGALDESWSVISIALAVAGILVLAALGRPLLRWRLGRKLSVSVKVREGDIAEINWVEKAHIWRLYGFHRDRMTVGHAQGLHKFCDVVQEMQGTLKGQWINMDWELDPPDEGAAASTAVAAASSIDELTAAAPPPIGHAVRDEFPERSVRTADLPDEDHPGDDLSNDDVRSLTAEADHAAPEASTSDDDRISRAA